MCDYKQFKEPMCGKDYVGATQAAGPNPEYRPTFLDELYSRKQALTQKQQDLETKLRFVNEMISLYQD